MPTKFVDKFAKKIDRSTDKFGFLGHSNVKLAHLGQKIEWLYWLRKKLNAHSGRRSLAVPPITYFCALVLPLPAPHFWEYTSMDGEQGEDGGLENFDGGN